MARWAGYFYIINHKFILYSTKKSPKRRFFAILNVYLRLTTSTVSNKSNNKIYRSYAKKCPPKPRKFRQKTIKINSQYNAERNKAYFYQTNLPPRECPNLKNIHNYLE